MPRFRRRGSSGDRVEASSIDAYQPGGGRYVRQPIDAGKVDARKGEPAKVAVLQAHREDRSHPYAGLREVSHQSLAQTRDQLLGEAAREGKGQAARPLQERAVGRGGPATAFIRFQDQLRDIRADEAGIARVFDTFGRSSLALCKQPSGPATLVWLGAEFAENLLSRIHAGDSKTSNGEEAERAASVIFALQAAQLLNASQLTQQGFDALMAGFAAGMRGLGGGEVMRTVTPLQGEPRQVSRLALADPPHGLAARQGVDSVLDTGRKLPNAGATYDALEAAKDVSTLPELMERLGSSQAKQGTAVPVTVPVTQAQAEVQSEDQAQPDHKHSHTPVAPENRAPAPLSHKKPVDTPRSPRDSTPPPAEKAAQPAERKGHDDEVTQEVRGLRTQVRGLEDRIAALQERLASAARENRREGRDPADGATGRSVSVGTQTPAQDDASDSDESIAGHDSDRSDADTPHGDGSTASNSGTPTPTPPPAVGRPDLANTPTVHEMAAPIPGDRELPPEPNRPVAPAPLLRDQTSIQDEADESRGLGNTLMVDTDAEAQGTSAPRRADDKYAATTAIEQLDTGAARRKGATLETEPATDSPPQPPVTSMQPTERPAPSPELDEADLAKAERELRLEAEIAELAEQVTPDEQALAIDEEEAAVDAALARAAFEAGEAFGKVILDGALNRANLRGRLVDLVDQQVSRARARTSAPGRMQADASAIRDALLGGIVNALPTGPGRGTFAAVLMTAQVKLAETGFEAEASDVNAMLEGLERLAESDATWGDALDEATGELVARNLSATRPVLEPDQRSLRAEWARRLDERFLAITSDGSPQAQEEARRVGESFSLHLATLEPGEQPAQLLEFLEVVSRVPALHGDHFAGLAGPPTVYQALMAPLQGVVTDSVMQEVLAGAIEISDREGDWRVLEDAVFLAAGMAREPQEEDRGMGPAAHMMEALEASKAGRNEAYQEAADRAITAIASRLALLRESGLTLPGDDDGDVEDPQDSAATTGRSPLSPREVGLRMARELGLDLPHPAINAEDLHDFFRSVSTEGIDEGTCTEIFRGLAQEVSGAALVAFTQSTLDFAQGQASLEPQVLRSFDALLGAVEGRLGQTLETGFGSPAVDALKRQIGVWRQSVSGAGDAAAHEAMDKAHSPGYQDLSDEVSAPQVPGQEGTPAADLNPPPARVSWFAPGEDPLEFDPYADDATPPAPLDLSAAPLPVQDMASKEPQAVVAAAQPDPLPDEDLGATLDPLPDEDLGAILGQFEKAAGELPQATVANAPAAAPRLPLSATETLLGEIANTQPGTYGQVIAKAGEFIASRGAGLTAREVDAIAQAVVARFPGERSAVVSDLPRSILETTPPQLGALHDASSRDDQRAAALACRRAAAWALRLMLSNGAAMNDKLQKKFLDLAFANTSRSDTFVKRVGYQVEMLGTAATVTLDRLNAIHYNGSIANLQTLVDGQAASNTTVPKEKEQLKATVRSAIIRGLDPDPRDADTVQLLRLLKREPGSEGTARRGESKYR